MVYLIPTLLSEDAVETIPPYVIAGVKECTVIFAENIRTARRFLKKMDPAIIIDDFEWYEIKKSEDELLSDFRHCLAAQKNVAIISEAGCPGVADPGQKLVQVAQQMRVTVKPFVGPSSILLALMASGMNGQQFCFHGYLPIDSAQRTKKIRQLEEESQRRNCTQLFIETPYRNDALFKDLLATCHEKTLLCLAANITAPDQLISTKTISEWKKTNMLLHKQPVIFLLLR